MIKTEVKGLEQARRNLKLLGQKGVRNSITRSVRQSAKPLVRSVRSATPKKTGALARSMRLVSVGRTRDRRGIQGIVTSKGTKSQANKAKNLFYSRQKKKGPGRRYGRARTLHLVVAGTKPHVIPGPISLNGQVYSNVQHPGAQQNDFMARTARSAFGTTVSAFSQALGPEVDKEVAKLPKT